MPRDAVVMSCITGDYDPVKPAPPEFPSHMWTTTKPTDDATAKAAADLGWIVHRVDDDRHPRMVSMTLKWRPWELLPDVDLNIWLDGSYRSKSPMFGWLTEYRWAAFESPWRNCHEAELKFMNSIGRYSAGSPIRAMAAIRDRGMPRRWGLWMSGLLVRDRTLPGVEDAHRTVLQMVEEHTCNDQGLLPYGAWRHECRPESLPGTPDHNRFAVLHPHNKVGYWG